MAINPKCTICKKELTKFGGILLSPPKRDTVKKFHICADCYKEIVEKRFTIRCRGIIIYKDALLVVKHTPESGFYALPGGHLEWGEDVKECMSRELKEELGVKGEIGRLLYVNTFMDQNVQSVEFFFEVMNSRDYASTKRPVASHANEICEIRWVKKGESVKILPIFIYRNLNDGILLTETTKFITGESITQNKKHLKKSLKTGALERASRNKALSGEWFNLEEELWSKKKRK